MGIAKDLVMVTVMGTAMGIVSKRKGFKAMKTQLEKQDLTGRRDHGSVYGKVKKPEATKHRHLKHERK